MSVQLADGEVSQRDHAELAKPSRLGVQFCPICVGVGIVFRGPEPFLLAESVQILQEPIIKISRHASLAWQINNL
jgi:hypothetical protein